MSRKFLSWALVLVMVFALAIPAMAADEPNIKAVMTGNGAKAALTVIVNGTESEPLIWSNNNTTVVELNGYVVSVAIKGNKVDKVTWEVIAVSDPIPDSDVKDTETGAAVIFTEPDIGGGGKTDGFEEETELPKVIVPVNDALFHCNNDGGNGRVWINSWTSDLNAAVAAAAAKGLKKASVGLEFTQAGDDAKRWILNTTEYVCPKCGRTDWISFSNKSGVPNGKNIQLQHIKLDQPPAPKWTIKLNKLVDGNGIANWAFDCEDITMFDLIGQINFYAYAVSGETADIPEGAAPAGIGEFDLDGSITFNDLPSGWYAIKEEFEPDTWSEANFEAPEIQYFYIDEAGGISKGSVIDWNDPEARAEFKQMYAIEADNFEVDSEKVAESLKYSGNNNVDKRANVANAFGAPDAVQGMNNGDEKFTGLGFFPEGVTYYFGDKNARYDIYRNPDPEAADLSLIEVTWTTNWHTEAVDVYLVNAVIDGDLVPGNTWIGTVYNRKKPVFEGLEGFGFDVRTVGNFTYTDIFFPTNIDKAAAVRLVDKTAEINTPNPTYNTYRSYDDGYDLDALVAYYTMPTNTFENKLDTTQNPMGTMNAAIDIAGTREVIEYAYEKNFDTKSGSFTAESDTKTINPNSGKEQWFRYVQVNVAEAPVTVNRLRYGNGAGDILDVGYTIEIDADGYIFINLGENSGSIHVELLGDDLAFNNNGGHVNASGMFETGLNVDTADVVNLYVHFESITYFDGTYTKVVAQESSESVPYVGEITLVVTDEEEQTVFECAGTLEELIEEGILDLSGVIAISGSFGFGKYYAALSGDGFSDVTLEGEIADGEASHLSFEFSPIVVTYEAREIDLGYPQN